MFLEIDDPEHEAMLMAALNDFCQTAGIGRESPDRLKAARLVLEAFKNGARTPEQLRIALAGLVHRKERAPRRTARYGQKLVNH